MTSFSNKHASVKETDCNNESNHQHSCEACTSNQPRPPVARRIRTVELSCLKRKPDSSQTESTGNSPASPLKSISESSSNTRPQSSTVIVEVPPAAVDEEVSETETEEESEDEALLTADERRRRLREREVDRIVFGNPHRAPNELLMEFLDCLMSKNFVTAKKLCDMILIYEPNNARALEFRPVIEEKLRLEEERKAAIERGEISESDESDEDDEDTATPSEESDSDSDDDEEAASPSTDSGRASASSTRAHSAASGSKPHSVQSNTAGSKQSTSRAQVASPAAAAGTRPGSSKPSQAQSTTSKASRALANAKQSRAGGLERQASGSSTGAGVAGGAAAKVAEAESGERERRRKGELTSLAHASQQNKPGDEILIDVPSRPQSAQSSTAVGKRH